MDTLARALLAAEALIEDGRLHSSRADRYAGWDAAFGRSIIEGERSLDDLWKHAQDAENEPGAVSGRQELLENWVRQGIERSR
jgi:xylose isomerase